jgi:hypothetical protein
MKQLILAEPWTIKEGRLWAPSGFRFRFVLLVSSSHCNTINGKIRTKCMSNLRKLKTWPPIPFRVRTHSIPSFCIVYWQSWHSEKYVSCSHSVLLLPCVSKHFFLSALDCPRSGPVRVRGLLGWTWTWPSGPVQSIDGPGPRTCWTGSNRFGPGPVRSRTRTSYWIMQKI